MAAAPAAGDEARSAAAAVARPASAAWGPAAREWAAPGWAARAAADRARAARAWAARAGPAAAAASCPGASATEFNLVASWLTNTAATGALPNYAYNNVRTNFPAGAAFNKLACSIAMSCVEFAPHGDRLAAQV